MLIRMIQLGVFLFFAGCGSSSISSNTEGSNLAAGGAPEPIGTVIKEDTHTPGLPQIKMSYLKALTQDSVQGTADHYDFEINPNNYRVFSEDLHGTQVHVAVHSAVNVTDEKALEWSKNIRDCWHGAWHVFRGYRYDKFAVLVRSPESTENVFSLSEAGVSIPATQFQLDDYEFVCHEMIHAWLGKLIAHEPDGTGNLFQAETFVSEGTVVYYSFRILSDVIGRAEYTQGMNERFEDYHTALGSALDLSIADLAQAIGTDFSHPGIGVLYARGALISYALDAKMLELGFSSDDLLAYLYENFGLTDTRWTQADLETAVKKITKSDFTNFFDVNLDTNAKLELEGSFAALLVHPGALMKNLISYYYGPKAIIRN